MDFFDTGEGRDFAVYTVPNLVHSVEHLNETLGRFILAMKGVTDLLQTEKRQERTEEDYEFDK